MSIESQFEREEEDIERRHAEGYLSDAEYRAEIRDLHREYRAAAQESAMDAYEAEMDRW